MGVTDAVTKDLFETLRSNAIVSGAIRFLIWVRSSFLGFVGTLGTIFLVSGLFLGEGAVAGMLVVLGVSAFIYAVLGVLGLKLIGYT